MKLPVSTRMVDKALAAMTSAVEVYNRPSFAYREETFAILALNAWELLAKAKIIKDAGNDHRAIWIYEPRPLKGGSMSNKLYIKANRTGNPMTLSIHGCIKKLNSAKLLDPEVEANVLALVAIRDNATHYFSASRQLAQQTAEISTATVRNFVLLAKDWFKADFSENFSLCLPLAFLSGPTKVQTVVTGGEQKLIDYLNGLAAKQTPANDYAVSLRVAVTLDKSKAAGAIKFQHSKDPDAIKVDMSEEDVRKNYPWSYRDLTTALKKKQIPGFVENSQYHKLRKAFEGDPKFAHARFLDPANKTSKSLKKILYNPNIMAKIEEAYALL